MVASNRIITGKIRGRFIELDRDLGLPEGESVTIHIEAGRGIVDPQGEATPSGEGFRRSAGSWADGGEELDQFIEETYRARHDQRADLPE